MEIGVDTMLNNEVQLDARFCELFGKGNYFEDGLVRGKDIDDDAKAWEEWNSSKVRVLLLLKEMYQNGFGKIRKWRPEITTASPSGSPCFWKKLISWKTLLEVLKDSDRAAITFEQACGVVPKRAIPLAPVGYINCSKFLRNDDAKTKTSPKKFFKFVLEGGTYYGTTHYDSQKDLLKAQIDNLNPTHVLCCGKPTFEIYHALYQGDLNWHSLDVRKNDGVGAVYVQRKRGAKGERRVIPFYHPAYYRRSAESFFKQLQEILLRVK